MGDESGAELILVVDDDRAITRILRSMLELEGYQVVEAASAVGIVERVVELKPHLLLIDLNMPEVSGLDLLDQLRSGLPALPPVLVLTGRPKSRDLAREMIAHGALDLLSKPVALDSLHQAVRLALRVGAARRESRLAGEQLSAARLALAAAERRNQELMLTLQVAVPEAGR